MLRGMKAKPINPRWLAFVDELMVDGNATRAYIAAGNHPEDEQNAAVSASKLIRNPKVAALIAERRAVIAAKSGWTVERIVARSGEIAMQDKPDRVPALALLAKRHPEFRGGPLVDNRRLNLSALTDEQLDMVIAKLSEAASSGPSATSDTIVKIGDPRSP